MIYSYDPAGRQLTRTLNDGTVIETGYDPAGRVTETSSGDVSIGYSYDPVGRLDTITRSNDTITNYSFDALSRPVNQTLVIPTTAQADEGFEYTPLPAPKKNEPRNIIDWSYARLAHDEQAVTDGAWTETVAYDPNGNITGSTKTITGVIPDGMVTPGVVTEPGTIADTYSYDPLNRLTASTSNDVTSSYGYDANSNRTSMISSDDPATPTVIDPIAVVAGFDAANQITQMTATTPDGITTTDHTYNLRGVRTNETITRPDGGIYETIWTYDELMRVTGIERPDRATSIERDVDGRATNITADTPLGETETEIGYNGWEPATINQPDHQTTAVIHDAAGNPVVEVDGDGTQRWLISSLLGDITATVNDTGAITELADAADYGTTTFITDQWSSFHQGTGELSLLNADQLQLFHQRVYQPGTATWNQADSLMMLNRHNYVGGNPTTYTDLYGYAGDCPAGWASTWSGCAKPEPQPVTCPAGWASTWSGCAKPEPQPVTCPAGWVRTWSGCAKPEPPPPPPPPPTTTTTTTTTTTIPPVTTTTDPGAREDDQVAVLHSEGFAWDDLLTSGRREDVCAGGSGSGVRALHDVGDSVLGIDFVRGGYNCREVFTKNPNDACDGTIDPAESSCWSGHASGRAADFEQIATDDGNELVDWLLAVGPDGEPAYNARIYGVQEIIWNGDPGNQSSPSCWSSTNAADTSATVFADVNLCNGVGGHADHVHITLTIDGAAGVTSGYGAG